MEVSDFIKHYSGQQQHLLVRYQDAVDHKEKYVSVADDNDTVPMQKVTVTIPPLVVNMLKHSTTMGSSHGLLCLYDDDMAVIWNPSISKAVAVVLPKREDNEIYETDLGFGVCRETLDQKIVKISYVFNPWSDIDSVVCVPELFTLSTGAWRSPYSSLPRKYIRFSESQVAIDGVLYWLADDGSHGFNYYDLIISFDITSEEFKEINLPDSLARNHARYLSIFKLRNALAVLQFDVGKILYDVWMMADIVSHSFIKLFTICLSDVEALIVREFRKSGEPVTEVRQHDDLSLVVYEPNSKQINNLGINGYYYDVNAYMETLLLLDQPDLIIYGNSTPAFEA